MKKQVILYVTIVIVAFALPFCKKKEDSKPTVYGCTDSTSTNYNPYATVDNGSCQYKKRGCMDPISINYDSLAEVDDGSCEYAGTGGNITIIAHPLHHGVPIFGQMGNVDTAFIKYNVQNYPGNNSSDYDLVIPGLVGDDYVSIPNMKPGRYFIKMSGRDSSINMQVEGFMPFTIFQSSGQYDLIVPVTE